MPKRSESYGSRRVPEKTRSSRDPTLNPRRSSSRAKKRRDLILSASQETGVSTKVLGSKYNALIKMGFDPHEEPRALLIPDNIINKMLKGLEKERAEIYEQEIAHLNQRR